MLLRQQPQIHTTEKLSQMIRQHILDYGIVGRSTDGDTGFIIFDDPFELVVPAIGFFTIPHYLEPVQEEISAFPPDLAIEVDDERNVWKLLRAGTKQVWVLHPVSQTVDVYSNDGVQTLYSDDCLDGGEALPAFRVPVCEIFTP